jgi:hypothetical protein
MGRLSEGEERTGRLREFRDKPPGSEASEAL